ncbi:uncharacterized protein LOC127705694 isoform X2 [Mytilus californianus]|uniref:uncharacterized protein LOC127705694 isoform X2 n=1 Tax=Mytilus californianus TaxID=6549 RepID=UPI002247711E|nr:uncharacterized protein LOC127705694 isoform X2 [Mytilus californianus]
MDDYSIKVLSWIGISLVTTFRSFLFKSSELRKEEDGLTNDRRERFKSLLCSSEPTTEQTLIDLIKHDTNNLLKWIRGDIQTIPKWMNGDDPKIPEWTKGETTTLPEPMTFQMVSFNRKSSLVTFRIIVLQNLTVDIETLIKWVGENENMCTVCTEEDKKTFREWISDNQQTITKSITKDSMTFNDMIKGLDNTLDEKTKQDIKYLTGTKGRSSFNTYRHYHIVLSKTSNKNTMTEIGARAMFEPGCPSALNITSTKVELKWDEPSVGADFIDFYKIMCEEKRICVTCFFETPGSSCKYVVEGLKPNTEYAFTIQAIKKGGNKGTVSQTFTVSTLEITFDRTAELLYVLFYIAVLIWFTYLFCYTVTTT